MYSQEAFTEHGAVPNERPFGILTSNFDQDEIRAGATLAPLIEGPRQLTTNIKLSGIDSKQGIEWHNIRLLSKCLYFTPTYSFLEGI